MTNKVTVYEKPTCSTCRQLVKTLDEMGVEFDKVNYYVAPLTADKISDLLKKMGLKARDILRTKEQTYRDLDLANVEKTESELIALMVKHPELMQRPIIEKGASAVLGRPVDNVRALFK
ncbi:MAG: hypothetical protein K2W95_26645 [Candidatus Obscuribacterales bacterium]|nr:hypothetical protein [Candidatus Obscuribacterales bacterium]